MTLSRTRQVVQIPWDHQDEAELLADTTTHDGRREHVYAVPYKDRPAVVLYSIRDGRLCIIAKGTSCKSKNACTNCLFNGALVDGRCIGAVPGIRYSCGSYCICSDKRTLFEADRTPDMDPYFFTRYTKGNLLDDGEMLNVSAFRRLLKHLGTGGALSELKKQAIIEVLDREARSKTSR